MIAVAFTHDDEVGRWDCIVTGARNALEARQAFSAVVLTIGQLEPGLLRHTVVQPAPVEGAFYIMPVV